MNEKLEIVHDSGYGIIARKVMRNKSLSIESKAIYAYLSSFAGNTGKAFPSVNLIIGELNISRERFYKYLKELKKFGFVEIEQNKNSTGQFKKNIYYLIDSPCTSFPTTGNPYTENPYTENPYTNNNNSNSNNSNSNNSKDNSSAKAKQIPYTEIIDYLNEKTNKNYKATSTANRKLIKARINEGYTLEDFKKVIDNKCSQWLKDEKMQIYLRPVTLFSNKFDNYLNEEIKGGVNNDNEHNKYKDSPYELL